MDAGQGEFSAVGFSYGASADGPVQSRAGGPIEDLGEEASSESSGMQQGSSNGHWLQHTLYPVADTHDTFTMLCMSILELSFAAIHMLSQCSKRIMWLQPHACLLKVSVLADSDDEEQDTDQRCDLLAANLGIDHFSVMLRRADKQEEDEALGQVKRPK